VQSDADHARYRRLLSHAFSEKSLREQEPLIKHYIDLLISRLHETCKNTQDMASWFNFVSFDIIGDLTLGESFDCLENSELHPWVAVLFKYFQSTGFIGTVRRFPLLNLMMPWFVPKSLLESRAKHMAFSKEKVMQRIERGTERPDFMSGILMHNDKEVCASVSLSGKVLSV